MLHNKQIQNFRYVNIFDGHFAVTAAPHEEGAEKRINKNNVEVWEYLYNTLTGKITGINVAENDYGKSWVIDIEDGPEKYVLKLPFTSRYTKGFLYKIGNADLTKPMDLQIGKFLKDGREIGYLTIFQGKKIEPVWTRESPGELPPLKKVMVRGQEIWDDSEQLIFLQGYIENVIAPKLQSIPNDEPIQGDPVGDLPF